MGGEGGDAFDVVSAVEENERPPPNRLEATLPAGLVDGPDDPVFVEGPPIAREDLGRGDGRRGVGALMAAGEPRQKRITAVLPLINEAPAVAGPPGFEPPSRPEGLGQGRAALAGHAPYLAAGRPSPHPADDRDPGLDDARLFESDLRQRAAQVPFVVLGDGGDDRSEGPDDIGGVEPPAHPDLDDGDVDLALGELEKGQGGHDLEVRWMIDELLLGHQAVDHGLQPLEPLTEALRGDRPPVDADPLLDPDEVRRRVQSRPEPMGPQDPGQHGRDRALAVRPGHVDGQEPVLGIAEGETERRDVLEAELDAEVLQMAEVVPALGRGHCGLLRNKRRARTR